MNTFRTVDRFLAIEQEMNFEFVEREEAIRLLLIGLLAKQHVLFLGPPGTAKSAMARNLCGRIGGKFFEILMAKTTTLDELYGPPSLKGLENDKYVRITSDTVLDADIALLDEVWKSNSAVLNANLGVMNERQYRNGDHMMKLPLQMVVGLSNELPEEGENLGALWDRFLLRSYVSYIKNPANFEIMLTGRRADTWTTLTLEDLADAQDDAAAVDVGKIIPQIYRLKQVCGGKNIVISDRRWRSVLALVRANAYLSGRTVAIDEDLEVLTAALWEQKDQIPQIRSLIMGMANPLDNAAMNLRDQALEAYNDAMKAVADVANEPDAAKKAAADVKLPQTGANKMSTLKRVTVDLENLVKQAISQGKDPARITGAMNDAIGWNREVAKACLGI